MILRSDKKTLTTPEMDENITLKIKLPSTDQSGDSSMGFNTSGGVKPAEIAVSLIVPFDNEPLLREIFDAARAMDDKQEPLLYAVTEDTVNAVGIMRVRFSVEISCQKASNLRAWAVAFSLLEFASIPERIEEREKENPPAVIDENGQMHIFNTNTETAYQNIVGMLPAGKKVYA